MIIEKKDGTKIRVDRDLDPPAYGNNVIEQFEYRLPFCRCLITTFVKHVHNAAKESGSYDYCTIQALRKEFQSPAWADLEDQNSKLVKLLKSAPFKNENGGLDAEHVDKNSLIVFGLLHC